MTPSFASGVRGEFIQWLKAESSTTLLSPRSSIIGGVSSHCCCGFLRSQGWSWTEEAPGPREPSRFRGDCYYKVLEGRMQRMQKVYVDCLQHRGRCSKLAWSAWTEHRTPTLYRSYSSLYWCRCPVCHYCGHDNHRLIVDFQSYHIVHWTPLDIDRNFLTSVEPVLLHRHPRILLCHRIYPLALSSISA